MYRITILYLVGTLQGMEIYQRTSIKMTVGKIYTASVSGSHYKVLSCEEV
jgi:hypothetical protein